MEALPPVPETERVEEFGSPMPKLRLQGTSSTQKTTEIPHALRRITDPLPVSPRSPSWSTATTTTYRARNTSPYARGHLRSKSSTASLAPPMTRTQSMPGVDAAGQLLVSPQQRPVSPSSPRGSPAGRMRIPRKPADDVFPGLGISTRALQGISESEPVIYEAEDAAKSMMDRSGSPTMGLAYNTFPRIRRPASPLRYVSQVGSVSSTAPSTPVSLGSSPSLSASSRFGDYGYSGYFTSSSVSSTPTSARSRSPSISSLETIPDSPDAEEAALEADRILQLKAAAEAEEGEESKGKNALDISGNRGRGLGGFGNRDKRKRWSVCGAERRGDLNLDTIWED